MIKRSKQPSYVLVPLTHDMGVLGNGDLGGVQTAVAEEFGEQLRKYQELMFPAAYGKGTREWAHLVLTKVTTCLCLQEPFLIGVVS